MSFESASSNVADVLRGGGLADAERMIGRGMDTRAIMAKLRERYTPIGGSPYPDQVYSAIIQRARASLEAGAKLQRKRSDTPLSDDDHVGTVGLPSAYQYSVVATFVDEATGQSFTKLFVIGSETELGKFTLLNMARVQATNWLSNDRETLGAGSSTDDLSISSMRVANALKGI